MVVVSHDRYLLRSVTDRLVLVADGNAETFDGDLDEEYPKWLAARRARQVPAPASTDTSRLAINRKISAARMRINAARPSRSRIVSGPSNRNSNIWRQTKRASTRLSRRRALHWRGKGETQGAAPGAGARAIGPDAGRIRLAGSLRSA